MILDKLTYRLPNQTIRLKHGAFQELSKPDNFEGFLISDFNSTRYFGFMEHQTPTIVQQDSPLVISQETYLNQAAEFVAYLRKNMIDKAILSRVHAIQAPKVGLEQLFLRLCENYPSAFCYLIESQTIGTWIGATPEILLELNQNKGETMALAGTKSSSDTSIWGEKELHEQQLVADFVYNQLNLHSDEVEQSLKQELLAGPVKHLVNFFQFSVAPNRQWALISNLHPTPAVSGFPRDKALKCIELFESHERSFYAGMIGIKSNKRTQLYVNLRCGKYLDEQLYLFVGGGLTKESIPLNEWDETCNKAKTISDLCN